MSDNTNTTQFVVVPAGVMRAAASIASNDDGRPVLRAVQLAGKVDGDELRVTVTSTDSYRLFTAEYALASDLFGGIEGEFEWLVQPTSKLGTAESIRVERVGSYKGAFEVTTYKGRSTTPSMNRACAKFEPAAYHRWDEVDGPYPNWRQLIPSNPSAAAGWAANPKYAQEAYKALGDATGGGLSGVVFEGMESGGSTGKRANAGGPLLFSARGESVTARCVLMPVVSEFEVVVGAAAKGGKAKVDKKAYDEMCELYRKHALREEELEAEVKRLTEEVEHERDMHQKYQARNVELAETVEGLEARLAEPVAEADGDAIAERDHRIAALEEEVMDLESQVDALRAEATKVVPFNPDGAKVVDDGTFITISDANGFIVRSGDGSPLLLMTETPENVWLTGATRALRARLAELLPDMFEWSAKRRAWWARKAV